MQRFGKRSGGQEKPNKNQDHKIEKRRAFALVGSFAGLLLLAIYLIAAAYPTSLFSAIHNSGNANTETEHITALKAEIAADPFKRSSEQLIAGNNEVMDRLFKKMGKKYTAPSLQFFEDTVTSVECGAALPSAGLFYCPDSRQMFVDLSFFKAVKKTHPLFTDLAQYYTIAHQTGHHIEQLLGITDKVEDQRNRLSSDEYQKLLYKQELLADYYAGVLMHYAWKKGMESGDAELAIIQATAISDELDQKDDVNVIDTYHYADISERANQLYKGYRSGNLEQGENDVFTAAELK